MSLQNGASYTSLTEKVCASVHYLSVMTITQFTKSGRYPQISTSFDSLHI
jgi:hypothetical protein